MSLSWSRKPRPRGRPRPYPRPPRGPWAEWRWTWCSSRCWSPGVTFQYWDTCAHTPCYLGRNSPGVAVALHDAGDAVPVANPVEGRDEDAAAHDEQGGDPVVQHRHQALGHRGPLLQEEYQWVSNLNELLMITFFPLGTKPLIALNSPNIVIRWDGAD